MEIRTIRDDEVPAWRLALIETFGGDPATDPEGEERSRALVALDRTWGAFDRGRIVATAAAFDFTLSVPGGALPMSGLTMVSVRPTHRRRGVLRAMMELHLEAARRHGDPIAGLWASEATIYGRFGYGHAVESEAITFHTTGAVVAAGRELDEVEVIDDAAAGELLPGVYDRAFAARPGMFSRTPAWWRYRRLVDRVDLRGGASPRRQVVARRDGVATGYVAYRQRLAWDPTGPSGSFEIDELMAIDPRAEATLWRFVASVDLYPKVSWWNAPVDCVLPWLLDDPRRVTRRRTETLWLRPEDIARVLAARTYAVDGRLRLGVAGETFELVADGGAGRAAPTGDAPEVVLDRSALGSIVLGGFAPSFLARAGRLSGEPRALALADRMFASPIAPWCAEIF